VLPGSTVNAINRGMSVADLEHLVAQLNQNYAGVLAAKNVVIPKLTLPARYWLGDNFHSMDLRVRAVVRLARAVAIVAHRRSVQPVQCRQPLGP
jgi:hypothetical protein